MKISNHYGKIGKHTKNTRFISLQFRCLLFEINTVSTNITSCLSTLKLDSRTTDSLILGIAKPEFNPAVMTPKTAMDLARVFYQEKALWAKAAYSNVGKLLEISKRMLNF